MFVSRSGQLLRIAAVVAASHFAYGLAHAWVHPGSITAMEWDAWPRMCQSEPRIPRSGKTSIPKNRYAPKQTKTERSWAKQFGTWHFCTGYIWLLRAEATTDRKKHKSFLSKGVLQDLNWVPRQIGPAHPLAPLVDTALVRALRILGEYEKAIKILNELKVHHPGVPEIYTAYTAIYFDQKKYEQAVDVLEFGNKATNDKVLELQYFLGVAYLKTGDIESARIYEKKAREGGFPLFYLTRQLAKYDAERQRVSSPPLNVESTKRDEQSR